MLIVSLICHHPSLRAENAHDDPTNGSLVNYELVLVASANSQRNSARLHKPQTARISNTTPHHCAPNTPHQTRRLAHLLAT
jgi:hypothetical protein